MDINELLMARRSIRKFKQNPIKRELLEKYVDAARVSPSAANLQPVKYAIVHSKEMTDKLFELTKWAGYLAPHYNPKEDERPTAYIVMLTDSNIRESGCDMDVGAAAQSIILSAYNDGVGTCWIASVDREKTSRLLNLADNFKVSCVIALGYMAETPKEVSLKNDDIKYYLDDTNTLCVPKRSLEEVTVGIY